jgi:hypothetical protein
MHDNDAPCGTPALDTSDAYAVHAELGRLAAAYPAFRFRTQAGWDRKSIRWVAERIRGLDPGLHTVITADLSELIAALVAAETQ